MTASSARNVAITACAVARSVTGCATSRVIWAVALSVLRLRKTLLPDPSAFRIPRGPTVPLVTVAIIAWFLTTLTRPEMIGIAVFVGMLTMVYLGMAVIRPAK